MADRVELLEAVFDSLPEGIALVDLQSRVILWNRAAETITGYAGADLLFRPVPEKLQPLLEYADWKNDQQPRNKAGQGPGRGTLVEFHHRMGHNLPAMVRILVVRDGLGKRIGSTVLFHAAESMDVLPHGEIGETATIEASQADMEDRLVNVFDDHARGGPPFGLLWITIDQAHQLRQTHGEQACESMMATVRHTLTHALRPGEDISRWGTDEFLVLSHERTAEMLIGHARTLAGLARTAEFRWWGDRVSLTASIGAAQVSADESLAQLLFRAQSAMLTSIHNGGNHVTLTPASGGH